MRCQARHVREEMVGNSSGGSSSGEAENARRRVEPGPLLFVPLSASPPHLHTQGPSQPTSCHSCP